MIDEGLKNGIRTFPGRVFSSKTGPEKSLGRGLFFPLLGLVFVLQIAVGLSSATAATLSPADLTAFRASVHSRLGCTSCHGDMSAASRQGQPGEKKMPRATCAGCHARESALFENGIHGHQLKSGSAKAPDCFSCHGSHDIKKITDRQSPVFAANLPATCGSCHRKNMVVPGKIPQLETGPHKEPYPSYLSSVHWKSLQEKGLVGVALCNDCHESHDLRATTDPRSKIFRNNIPETCGRCHIGVLSVYNGSIHGQALKQGMTDAPVCTDCHGEHTMESSQEKTSSVAGAAISKTTCPKCHSAERLVDEYGVVSQRVTKYLDSYHGVESRAGRPVVANCSSCHGHHDIRPSSDPRSSINKKNLPATCGKCHPNATANFAKGSVHGSKEKDAVAAMVRRIYLWMILITIGGMLTHNAILMGRMLAEKHKHHVANSVERFTLNLVIQHLLLTLSFFVLAVSGFALHFPDAWWSSWLVRAESGAVFRGFVHRFAAVVLVGVGFYHIFYVALTKRGKMELRELVPNVNDAKQAFLVMKNAVTSPHSDVDFGRYNYVEKAEYWALVWGTVVMGVTGFPMWFPNIFLTYFPRSVMDIFRAVHYYEAWLAVLAIIVWHFFHVMFHPETYPMNWTWITGKMDMHELKRRPKEYEKAVLNGESDKVVPSSTPEKD